MWQYLFIGLGSASGGLLRHALAVAFSRSAGDFPWETLLANLMGCTLIGMIAAWIRPEGRSWLSPDLRAMLMIGFCGGFTTVSIFSWQTLELALSGRWLAAGAYILLSYPGCVAASWLAYVWVESISNRVR